ncbi:MAG TPA: ARMT1-like domain-containing protein [Verrucomicrobiae bacterium]|nr:ARMT1-like domain-containing protein [Verrucomicrobiae bacterium]
MLVCSTCIPCYLKQALNSLSRCEITDRERTSILNQLCLEIPKLAQDKSPAENSSLLLHRVSELAGVADPFERDKAESNRQAMDLWPWVRNIIRESADPLFTALKVAVAGNVVDLGILDGYDLKGSLEQAMKNDFARNDYQALKGCLEQTKNVLIIGDNSGEIAFDRLLVEELVHRGCEVTYVVKSGPVLNDATGVDAETVGMAQAARVITTGNNFLGVVFKSASREFATALNQAGCIIAKGQANYESLEGTREAGPNSFFILKAKCEVVAENLGVKFGDLVLARNQLN